MQDRVRAYAISCVVLVVCAVAAALYARQTVVVNANPWIPAVCFFAFGALAELLAVKFNENNDVEVMPSTPIFWASISVVGPFAAAMASVSAGVLAGLVISICHYLTRGVEPIDAVPDDASSVAWRAWRWFVNRVVGIGRIWPTSDAFSVIVGIAIHSATLVLNAALAGIVYHALGGQFLITSGWQANVLTSFVLPFVALVVVYAVVDQGMYVAVLSFWDPVAGARGSYGIMLRAKLALLEDVIPVWRGQVFVIVVAMLLAYLFATVHVWGFVLAVTPVLALRDFFHQWVETKRAYLDTITTLATYMQHYHPYTRGHLKRVADLSEGIARELRLSAESIYHMRTAGFLHDIGKIGVSEQILDKTEKLTDEEWEKIKEHPVKGAEIISHLEFLEGIVDWIRYHHKWYNGSGYPATNGNGFDLPIEAAIIAAADAFDAMTDDRELTLDWRCDSCGHQPELDERPEACPKCGAEKRRRYREPKSLDEAIEELRRGAGTQFHPGVVKCFLKMVERDGIRLNA